MHYCLLQSQSLLFVAKRRHTGELRNRTLRINFVVTSGEKGIKYTLSFWRKENIFMLFSSLTSPNQTLSLSDPDELNQQCSNLFFSVSHSTDHISHCSIKEKSFRSPAQVFQFHTDQDRLKWDSKRHTEPPILISSSLCAGLDKQHKPRVKQRVGAELIDTALCVCQEYLNSLEHCDIDISLEAPPTLSEQQWAKFIQGYYLVIQ